MSSAVIVIDMLKDFIEPDGALSCGPLGQEIVKPLAERIRQARDSGEPVIYVCDRHRPDDPEFDVYPPHCVEGSEGAEIVDELAPVEGDPVIPKRRYNGFFQSELLLTLREKKVERLELAGVCTNICVLYTAAEAVMWGFQVAVNTNLVASFDPEAHEFAIGQMKEVLAVELLE